MNKFGDKFRDKFGDKFDDKFGDNFGDNLSGNLQAVVRQSSRIVVIHLKICHPLHRLWDF